MFIKKRTTKTNSQSNFLDSNENKPSKLFRNAKALSLVLALLFIGFASSETSAQTVRQPPIPEIIKQQQRFNPKDPNPLARNPNSSARYVKDRYGYTWYFDGSRWYCWTRRGWYAH